MINTHNAASQQSKPYRILHRNGFWDAYHDYSEGISSNSGKSIQSFKNFITGKHFPIKKTGATYRTINHWTEVGVIDDDRLANKNGWRKFSIVDLVWLEAVVQLKKFGFSLEQIKVGYNDLIPSKHILEFAVACAFLRKHSYLVAFDDGALEIATITDITRSVSMGLIKDSSYLLVNINNCLKKILPNLSVSPSENVFELDDNEFNVLASIRLKDWDEINITKRNGEIENINTKKIHITDMPRVADIISRITFGECRIINQQGKTVFIEEINKERV